MAADIPKHPTGGNGVFHTDLLFVDSALKASIFANEIRLVLCALAAITSADHFEDQDTCLQPNCEGVVTSAYSFTLRVTPYVQGHVASVLLPTPHFKPNTSIRDYTRSRSLYFPALVEPDTKLSNGFQMSFNLGYCPNRSVELWFKHAIFVSRVAGIERLHHLGFKVLSGSRVRLSDFAIRKSDFWSRVQPRVSAQH
ncbi:hypothetical protein ACJQWK_11297 [Exserohilum turcicum]